MNGVSHEQIISRSNNQYPLIGVTTTYSRAEWPRYDASSLRAGVCTGTCTCIFTSRAKTFPNELYEYS
eukprot:scaffold277698_cov18-Prasinocladus_malaysianus.AAC.1